MYPTSEAARRVETTLFLLVSVDGKITIRMSTWNMT
jgi:hypothetical protein